MDRIIRITLALFLIILAAFVAIHGYNFFIDSTYRNSFTGNYTYTYTFSTDGQLHNVTLFLPIPDDRTGNSPVVTYLGTGTSGMPSDWNATLFGTGKATLLKVTTPSVSQPEGITPSAPYKISFSMEFSQKTPVETRDPVSRGVMFRPVQDLREMVCPAGEPAGARCASFTTPVYADYTAAVNTTVTFTSAVLGKNSWKIFEPESNEYRTGIHLTLKGSSHGWATADGTLSSGIGDYEAPFGT